MNANADMTATRTAVHDEAHAGHIQGIASREARVRHREHQSGTPMLGCLAVIAGLVSLLDNERVALFAKLTETAEGLRDLGEIEGSHDAILRSEAAPHTSRQNVPPLLGVLGILAALL
ncbi:MAG: hypothetical protein WA231_19850 [Methylocella sp.]